MTDNSEGSEPVKLTEKERIEKAATKYSMPFGEHEVYVYDGYVTGAQTEHELLANKLKEERNKAVDSVIDEFLDIVTTEGYKTFSYQKIKIILESLKK